MKKSVIKAIFNGERGNGQQIKTTEEEHRLAGVVSDTYDELIKRLSPEQLKFHETFNKAREYAFIEELDNNYVEGFKLGLLIGIECMED